MTGGLREAVRQAYEYPPSLLREKPSVKYFNRLEEEFLWRNFMFTGSEVVLDAGCGWGRWAIQLAEHVREVVAVDASQSFITELNSRGIENIKAYNMDLAELSYSNHFDAIIMSGVLEHFREKQGILYKASRMLKPGGQLYVSCWSTDMLEPIRTARGVQRPFMRVGDKKWYLDEPTVTELEGLLACAGFKEIQVTPIEDNPESLPKELKPQYLDYVGGRSLVNVANIGVARR